MYKLMCYAHSHWAYLVVLMTLVGFLYFLARFFHRKELGERDRKLALFTLISVHVQFLIGLILYTLSPLVHNAFQHFGTAVKNPQLRLIALEHPLAMVTAAVLVTLAYRKVKRQIQQRSPVTTGVVLLFLFTFLLILSRIPWHLWFSV